MTATGAEVFWWVVLPYLALGVFAVGHVWRWRYDQFGWTSRSTQLQERRMLKWGSPLFHYGTFAAIGGHVIGVLIPERWTKAVGIPDDKVELKKPEAITGTGDHAEARRVEVMLQCIRQTNERTIGKKRRLRRQVAQRRGAEFVDVTVLFCDIEVSKVLVAILGKLHASIAE
jgi:respiratory nitrate reductase gamma subunit